MTCCVPDAMAMVDNDPAAIENDDAALATLSRRLGDGTAQLEFAVPDAHCAACIRTIETALGAMPMVRSARVNLTRRRVRVVYDPAQPASLLSPAIRASGYHNYVLDPAQESDGDPALKELLRALAVAGFAAANIMLFSVSIWSGANEATRDLFHWISAIIALPAIAYAGRLFFRSAWRVLRVGKTNMDVPISIGITLATALSLFETMTSGHHAYFDGVTMLLFFLLIGRTLDHLMRERARNAITGLARLQPRGGTLVREDGAREYIKLDEIAPGMMLEIKAGERVPVDSILLSSAASSFDYSIISGESLPHVIAPNGEIIAGAASLGGPILVRAERAATGSFLARMAQMMDAAETARTRPRRIADRAAAIYAPIIHTIAFSTFAGWLLWTGGDWHTALMNAVAVLIITCPCALALAVPIVHVVAAGRLFERGIMMKDGAALERIAEIDLVAFDKTGTLTEGNPRLVQASLTDAEAIGMAAALAASSTHPLSRAIARHLDRTPIVLANISELPGKGIEALKDGALWRLGSAAWCGVTADANADGVWLSRDGAMMGHFTFEDSVRPEARRTVETLRAMRFPVRLLSGDAAPAVMSAARQAGITEARAGLSPEAKLIDVAQGRTLMVGDGINDAPAMRAAYASMAPASATDIGRSAADFVFTGNDLGAVSFVIATARGASRIVVQNLAIAIGYNAIAVPLAVSGQVTPLIAAIAMSASSIIVVANALRLRLFARHAVPAPRPLSMQEHAA